MAHLSHRPTLLLRPEEARDSNGPITPYTEGAMRIVDGRYGRAWRLEESTTNLAANPSAEVGLTNIGAWASGANTRVSTQAWTGLWSVQTVTPGTVSGEGLSYDTLTGLNLTGSARPFTGSVYAKGAGTVNVWCRINYTDATNTEGTQTLVALTGSWQRIVAPVVTANSAKTITSVLLFVRTSSVQAVTYWTDGAQIEEKAYVTSYTDGSLGTGYAWSGTAHASSSVRNVPLVQFPVGELANPYVGTVLVRYKKITNPTLASGNNNYIFAINQIGVAGMDGFGITQPDMKQRVRFGSGTTINETPLANREPVTLDQWDTAVVRWLWNEWEQRLSNSTPQTFVRAEPVGNFQGDVRLSLGNPLNSANADIESVLVYNEYLEEHEIQTLMNMQGSWTWDNVQPYVPSVTTVAQVTSYQMIPMMLLARDGHDSQQFDDISQFVEKCTVEYNPDRAIKYSLKATLSDPFGIIRPYKDYLVPRLRIVYDDGYTVERKLGYYCIMPTSETFHQQHQDIEVDGRDLTWLLSVDVFDNGYSVAAGTNVVTAVKAVLTGAGFSRINIQNSTKTLSVARSWKAGTSKLTVVNDLLTGAGYYSITCDADGAFVSIPYVSIVNPTVVVDYDTTKPSYVKVVRSVKKDTTQDRIANKVVVVKDNANEAPIVATKINTNPNSPTSTVNLGVTIAKVVTNSQIVDQASADTLAMQTLEEASQQYNKLTIYTTPDVERGINEIYRLNIVNPVGEVVADGLWRCRGWKIGFTPQDGPMVHELSNIDNPPMEV